MLTRVRLLRLTSDVKPGFAGCETQSALTSSVLSSRACPHVTPEVARSDVHVQITTTALKLNLRGQTVISVSYEKMWRDKRYVCRCRSFRCAFSLGVKASGGRSIFEAGLYHERTNLFSPEHEETHDCV